MSRHKQSPTALATGMKRNQQGSSKPAAASGGQTAASSALSELTPEEQAVKRHRRCPCCWNNPEYRGKARRLKWRRQINGPVHQRCYVCDACGTEWQVEFREEVDDSDITIVTSRVVKITPTDEGQSIKEESRQTNEPSQESISGQPADGQSGKEGDRA